ncbi:NB-ARC domain-containing protein [Leifsonia aquatica]|uniref:NB-ARC domain-containing protein n=1 Tax=Leifsonia aquatica TaxID=144185 RepID=UPI0004A7F23B|nr:NB-ARC domain-containing protein [Leifsonia aquatica]
MSFNATRLTCFALISSFEGDCRELVSELDSDAKWPGAVTDAATARLKRARSKAAPTRELLVEYLDFADSYQILLANKQHLDASALTSLSDVSPYLGKLTAVRNRVAHSRPMEIDDLATVHDIARNLSHSNPAGWPTLQTTLDHLENDPAFVLGLTVQLPSDPLDTPLHNLPVPDFDETGFFGRSKELRAIKRALLGPWPVVSILGDGGIGKTAIAVKAAYELLDDKSANFDAVVWVSAKATTLTSGEIKNIGGAIQDSLGMFEAAAAGLGADLDANDVATEVLSYLGAFRILLILDNLETVTDQRLRNFLLDLPNGSKVLVTSRIGLGIENPIKLEPLSTEESRGLLRSLSSIRNVQEIKSLDERNLDRLVSKLKGHPLYIKWLVAGVQTGRRPFELINDNSLLLDFCMSNVYDKLGEGARRVLQSMQVVRGPRGQGELAYLNDMTAQQIQASLLELMTTNFVSMRHSGDESLDGSYETGDFASQYLARHQPVSAKFRSTVSARAQSLTELGQQLRSHGRSDRFDSASIDIRGPHDVPAARLLFDAQKRASDGRFDDAVNLCHEAQTLSPTYYEAWRIEAFVQDQRQDRFATISAFERAYELAEESPIAGYHFGVYLTEVVGDHERALAVLQKAARDEPATPPIIMQISRTHFYREAYLESVDSCRALASLQQNASSHAENVELALRAAVFGVERALWDGELAHSADLLESSLQVLSETRIEYVRAGLCDWILRLAHLASTIAAESEGDPFIASKVAAFAPAFRDKVRVIEPELLDRRTGLVVRFDSEKMYAFVQSGGLDFFFHRNELVYRSHWQYVDSNVLVGFEPDDTNAKGPRAHRVRLLV